MSFKLLLFQLGFTCITAADKLRFILSDSQCLRAFNELRSTRRRSNSPTYKIELRRRRVGPQSNTTY